MEIRDVSLNYLTHQSRTSGEMEQHLRAKGFSREEIASELESLRDFRYIDDTAYAQQYYEYGCRKGWGFGRIRRGLLEKGASQEALEELEPDREAERERALAEARKLLGAAGRRDEGLPDEGEARRKAEDKLLAKAGRRLSALGYDSDTIYRTLGALMKRDQEF